MWVLLWLFLATPALAQTPVTGATVPASSAQYFLSNVQSQGADPTGVEDTSPAINRVAADTQGGNPLNIYLPAGTYHLKSMITLNGGRCLVGDGRGMTILKVGQDFAPAAPAVIQLVGQAPGGTNEGLLTPCVHDLSIIFDQPSDQASRANFLPLGQCTAGLGGTGCIYPPAIFNAVGSQGRIHLWNLRLERCWTGIDLEEASGVQIDTVDDSCLNVGLILNNGSDFGYVEHWEHWAFGITGGTPTAPTGLAAVYYDGNTYAMQLGATEGDTFHDIRTWRGRIALTSNFSWASFSDLKLDGVNSTLEVAATQGGAGGLQISNVYASGPPTNGHCQIDIGAGNVLTEITNLTLPSGGTKGICVAGGQVNVMGGFIYNATPTVAVGTLHMTGVYSYSGVLVTAYP